MSGPEQEIVESVRRAYEAINRGDFDSATTILHPEIEFIRLGDLPPLTGANAVRAWIEPDALEDQRWEPLEYRVQGRKVLVRQRVSARGASSGIELDVETLTVWTIDDRGLVTRIEAFSLQEEREALEAAGLSEDGRP